jgi:FAD/FMN-containing dehydrogenase/Fe-S oxidoreductase
MIGPLHSDLVRLTRGEVFTDPVIREVYATAACLYRIVPQAVVRPKTAGDIGRILTYAAERGLPVTARGAGSSVAGQALGEGIVLDLAAHLTRIVNVDRENRVAVVEPGVVLAELNRQLRDAGLCFPPDPSSGDYATIGGMIANNSSGPRSLKYGDTRAWTDRVEAVLADGSTLWLEEKPYLPFSYARSPALEKRIYSLLPWMLVDHHDEIERSRPRVPKNSSGYHVWDLIAGHNFNPTPLIVGSEGTLAIVTRAELRLAPRPGGRATALLLFDDLHRAGEAVQKLLTLEPEAVEIMDELFIRTVREHKPELRELLPDRARALLLLEFAANNRAEADRMLAAAAKLDLPGLLARFPARTEAEAQRLWAVRKAASPILYRLPGRRLTRFIEDVVVPPARLVEGIARIQEILARHGTEAPVLGHAGSGNLHLNPRLNLERPEDCQAMKAIAEEVYSLVIGMGGSITGEHGDGRLRTPYVARQFPELVSLFREIKELFDPKNILNPGLIVAGEGGAEGVPIAPLRQREGVAAAYPELQEPEIKEMMRRCHGCGHCRTYCPVYAATGREEALPRAKVAVARAVAEGALDAGAPEVPDGLRRLASLCTFCQRCLRDCPTGIETARAMRALAADHPRPARVAAREALFARAPAALLLGSLAPGAAALAAASPLLRAGLRRALLVNAEAPLPRPGRERWRDRAPLGPAPRGEPEPVLFYPGCLGRFADPEGDTLAALEIIAGLGYEAVAPHLPCCGEARLAAADLAGARSSARGLMAALKPYLERGLPLVTACPNCLFTLRHDYPWLLGPEAAPLAGRTLSVFELVGRAEAEGRLALEFKSPPVFEALFHRGCRQAALGGPDEATLLDRIPGLALTRGEGACCGLAGAYGLREENAAPAAALASRLRREAREAGLKNVISGCPSCRLQIEAMGLNPVSPLALLRWSLRLGTPFGAETPRTAERAEQKNFPAGLQERPKSG